MSDMLLRIILASYLAIWSPAMCCCGVKAVIGAVTNIETGDCHGVTSAAAQIESEDQSMDGVGGCCGQRDVAEACDEPRPADAPSPCRCHESIDSKVRLDTGAKISAPALAHVSTLPSFSPLMAMFMTSPFVAVTPCGSCCDSGALLRDRQGSGLSACLTLLAQRTLLLI